jgi:DNA/RNA endonuclease YhcR with UshA esterase domain
MALIDLGAPYPNQLLTIVLKGNVKNTFSTLDIKGKILHVEGPVSSYKGKPQIVLSDPNHIEISPD